jgi:hypothetical protein
LFVVVSRHLATSVARFLSANSIPRQSESAHTSCCKLAGHRALQLADGSRLLSLRRPADGQPLRRFIVRSASFEREDFEKLLEHQGLFNGAARLLG